MKRIWLSPYSLTVQASGEQRKGYLLRLQTEEFEFGYADIFPWPQFGDPSVGEIPKLLLLEDRVQGALLNRSLLMAERDGQARANRVSLLESKRLKNHYMVGNLTKDEVEKILVARDQGFTSFKLKIGAQPIKEKPFIETMAKYVDSIRFDFNCRADHEYLTFLQQFSEKTQFIEDPFPDPALWGPSPRLAYDQPGFDFHSVQTSWQIFKPAKQAPEQIKAPKVVLTSYLDHPVGVAHAFYEAYQWGEQCHDYGLMSHHVYKQNSFSEELQCEGPWLSFESGYGIGFDSLLEQQSWAAL